MNNIYEVERDDYVGFIDQLCKDKCTLKQESNEGTIWYKFFSKTYGNLLCVREIYKNGEEHYYIFDMPKPEERHAAPAKRKIVLENKEEVQSFFDILSKITQEKKVN